MATWRNSLVQPIGIGYLLLTLELSRCQLQPFPEVYKLSLIAKVLACFLVLWQFGTLHNVRNDCHIPPHANPVNPLRQSCHRPVSALMPRIVVSECQETVFVVSVGPLSTICLQP